MKSKYEGSVTERNMIKALAMESQARNKYTYFASMARKEGYEQIAEIFLATADNEKEHAEIWFKALGMLDDTPANLMHAAAAENEEWSEIYRTMAREAEEEGFSNIADIMRNIADIEHTHEERFRKLLHMIERHEVFSSKEPTAWICGNCGYVHYGLEAPEECPVCDHPMAYFRRAER